MSGIGTQGEKNGENNIPLTAVVTTTTTTNKRNDNSATTKLLNNDKNATDGPNISLPNALEPDPMGEIPGSPEGFNVYRNKKTLTQGLMDIALFSANANQLRYILENGNSSVASYYISASLIILSLILQIAIGFMLLMSTRYNVTVECQRAIAYKYGNYVTIGIFLITVVNVFIVAFGDLSVI